MDKVILIDGVRYLPYIPQDEKELEDAVVEHSENIFGENTIYLDIKKKLKSEIGKGTIPDGYLLDIPNKKLWLVEIELSTHQEFDHIAKQIMNFNSALGNYRTRQRLATIIREYIESDPILFNKAQNLGLDKNHAYEFLLNKIIDPSYQSQNTQVYVVIDKKTDKIVSALNVVNPTPLLLELQTFVRESVGNLSVHLHLMDTIQIQKKITNQKKAQKISYEKSSRPRALPQEEYYIPILETLVELGGSAKRKEVIEKVFIKVKDKLLEDDYKEVPTGDIRWKDRCAWARHSLKLKGYISSDSPYGIWEITDAGREYLRNYKK